MISLDTNVLVYAVDKTAGRRHDEARAIVDAAPSVDVGLAEQAIIEFLNAARKVNLSSSRIFSVAELLVADFTLLFPSPQIVEDTIALLKAHKLNAWDARLLAVCQAHGCTHLLSEDMQDGTRYGSVMVVNPFKAVNATLVQKLLTP
ncbi:MAG: PIN domain-containing protein [Rhizomicrobium sp.]